MNINFINTVLRQNVKKIVLPKGVQPLQFIAKDGLIKVKIKTKPIAAMMIVCVVVCAE